MLALAILVVSLCWSQGRAASLSSVPTTAWAELNRTVNGTLHVGTPLASNCYLRYDNGSGITTSRFDGAACANLQQNKGSPEYMTGEFGGYTSYNFAPCVATSEGCAISAFSPVDPLSPLLSTCHQGGVPSMYVDAQSVSDVQACLRFVETWRIPLVVKNTGHDYRGRSNAPDSFAIWTHNIRPPIAFNEKFVADKCGTNTAEPALTYGAGQQFQGLYDEADKHGYMIIGGASPTVGASGGWITGGGHSFASPNFGLGVDNVLQMRVVLPNGTFVTASRCQNQDIFFALRGGGGGTFGVVMETTSRLYPITPMQSASIVAVNLAPDAGMTFINIMIDNAEKWAKEGWGGYVGPDVLGGRALIVALATSKLTLEEAKASMKPFTDFLIAQKALHFAVTSEIKTLQSGYKEFLNTPFIKVQEGLLNNIGMSLSSRLVPKDFFNQSDKKQQLRTTMKQIVATAKPNFLIPFFVLLVPPTAFTLPESDKPNGPGAASVSPAWRDSYWHVYFQNFWDAADPTAGGAGNAAKAFEMASRAADPLRKLAPNSGAYMNEADPFEPDYIQSFWGRENYARLSNIKKAVDPHNIMTCYNCVGWDSSDPRYGCYPKFEGTTQKT